MDALARRPASGGVQVRRLGAVPLATLSSSRTLELNGGIHTVFTASGPSQVCEIFLLRWETVRSSRRIEVRQRYSWLGITATLIAYGVTISIFLVLLQRSPEATFHWSPLGGLYLLTAVILSAGHIWMLARAHGFQVGVTIAQGIFMGMISDLLIFHGLALFYFANWVLPGLIYGLLFVAAVSLMALAVMANADSLARARREKEAQERDGLTGLLNRYGVTQRYTELPIGTQVVVAMLDLNDLKSINDLGGHGAGDHHLRAISQALDQRLPPGAFVGRWGGDEFVAILPGLTDTDTVLRAIQAQVPHPQRNLPAFSYGAVLTGVDVPLNRVLARADQRMYEQKSAAYQTALKAELSHSRHVSVPEFPHFLVGLGDQRTIAEQGLSKAAELAGFESWFLLNLRSGQLRGRARPEDHIEQVSFADLQLPGGIIDRAITQQELLWAADYEQSVYAQPLWVSRGLKSVVVRPVMAHGQVEVVIGFFSHQTWRSITPQARQLLETVGIHLSHQLERDRVLSQVEASVEAGITGMGVILEARDLETAGHTVRVVELSQQLGRIAGLDSAELQALRLGAYLHDVGKLAIPDRILLKPGPLDAEEWAVMKHHSEWGAHMASRLPSLPEQAVTVVRSHHERWDGTGYPQGLAGEQIPLLARLFALCDVYDALVSTRPYKQAWTPQAARQELVAQAGRQFDPRLTALFIERMVQNTEGEPGPPVPSP